MQGSWSDMVLRTFNTNALLPLPIRRPDNYPVVNFRANDQRE